jgi:hypothetical protein
MKLALRILTANLLGVAVVGTAPLAILNKGDVLLNAPGGLWAVLAAGIGLTFFYAWKGHISAHLPDPAKILVLAAVSCAILGAGFLILCTQALMRSLPSTQAQETVQITNLYVTRKAVSCPLEITVQDASQQTFRICAAHMPHPELQVGQRIQLDLQSNALGRQILAVLPG